MFILQYKNRLEKVNLKNYLNQEIFFFKDVKYSFICIFKKFTCSLSSINNNSNKINNKKSLKNYLLKRNRLSA